MNCVNHTDTPAVTSCVQCATGMCRDCIEAGITVDSKSMCAQCAPGALRNAIAQLKSQRWRNKLKFGVTAGIICIGFYYAAKYLLGDEPGKGTYAFLTILFFFGLAGALGTLLREEVNVTGHALLFAVGRPDVSAMVGLFNLVAALVLGIFIAPKNMYRYFTTFRFCDKTIGEYEQLLARF